MVSAFSTALSALSADSTAINVVGNNLANLNTTGFKASDIDFQDLISQSLGVSTMQGQVGMGVGQVSVIQNFSQGSITNTNGAMDAAIQGDGFFVLKDSNNTQLFTRDGSFQLDSQGNLLTVSGDFVQGWMANNGVVNANGAVTNITVPTGTTIAPVATTNLSMNVNLNASVNTTDPGATFSAPIQVYDTQGTAHTLTISYTKTSANNWDYSVTIPQNDLAAGGNNIVATGSLTFDQNGNLTSPAAGSPVAIPITGLADGAADMNINWNLYNTAGTADITQYSQTSGMANPVQDGNAAGQVSKVAIQNNGLIVADYTNGQQVTLGQLALASIANPTSLIQVGNNNLQASAATAQAAIGAAGTGGRGAIEGGALESSTTDMAAQFTQLLTFERSYQAASRVITTSDTLMQETVNLIHP